MKEITGKELVIRIKGEVQESNLADFEETALAVLDGINRDLKTDQDFAAAKKNIKDCKLIESRIHNARQSALNSTESINELISVTGKLEEKFRQTRLDLGRIVKAEESARKLHIVDHGKEEVARFVAESEVVGIYQYDRNLFSDAIKGKSSLAKMEEKIAEVVEDELEKIRVFKNNYTQNVASILITQVEFPGLFPDINQLAVKSSEIVESEIESRVNKFKLELIEKKQREEAAAKIKEEADAKRKEEQEAAEEAETERLKVVVISEPIETHEPTTETPPPPIEEIPLPPLPPSPGTIQEHNITIENEVITELIDKYGISKRIAAQIVYDIVNGSFRDGLVKINY